MQINYINVLREYPEISVNKNAFQNIAEKIIDYYERHKNPPLTLKQLDCMYSIPIFIISNLNNKNIGWYISERISSNGYLSALNAFSLSQHLFDIKSYHKTWVAFKYERQEYINIANPKLVKGDLLTENFFYFLCNNSKIDGWKEVISNEGNELKVCDKNDNVEYFDLDQYDKTWRTYKYYRESI